MKEELRKIEDHAGSSKAVAFPHGGQLLAPTLGDGTATLQQDSNGRRVSKHDVDVGIE